MWRIIILVIIFLKLGALFNKNEALIFVVSSNTGLCANDLDHFLALLSWTNLIPHTCGTSVKTLMLEYSVQLSCLFFKMRMRR